MLTLSEQTSLPVIGVQNAARPPETPATERVWELFRTKLLAFIRRQVANPSCAEDILQEVFPRIHLHLPTLRNAASLESWVYQITRNAITDYYRDQHPVMVLTDALELAVPVEEENRAAELVPCVQAMIASLPAVYREALELTVYQGLTQQELAAAMDISLSGAKSRVQRARSKLEAILMACCHLEFDHARRLIDYRPRCALPSLDSQNDRTSACGCCGPDGCACTAC